MPNKTIYVSDSDLPLLERAQALAGGNLSAAIAVALREYVRSADVTRQHQYDSVTVSVGPPGHRRPQRFTAVCLARWQRPGGEDGPAEELVAYGTARQRIALYRRTGAAEERPGGPPGITSADGTDAAPPPGSIAEAEAWDGASEGVLEVYDTAAEFTAHVPHEFASVVADALAALEIEELDI